MGIPLIQQLRVGSYIVKQRLAGQQRYPLVLMLEPLFRCNLACAGCGKIDYPDAILNKGITVSPGYAYERAPDQAHFLNRRQTKELFRSILRDAKERKWEFSQSTLFLDFLAGNQSYHCTPWSNPTRNVFGWQRPCYLLGEGYAKTFTELMTSTQWDDYGVGNYEKCADCMVHSGFEGTAVKDTVMHPLKALMVSLKGVEVDGEMAPDISLDKQRPADFVFSRHVEDSLARIQAEKVANQNKGRAAAE